MQGIRYFLNNSNGDIEVKRCNNSIHSTKAHFHNEVSIGLIEKGCSKTEIGGSTYELTDRTFLIIPPNMVHKCNPYDYEQWSFRMLYINKEWFQSAFDIESEKIKFSYREVNQNMFSNIINLFDNIENKLIDVEDESKLLRYISVLNEDNNKYFNKEISANFNLKKIDEVRQYINANYLNYIKLNELAKVADISKYYLIKQFEECSGLSPHQYITNLRINHAKKLLKSNKNSADIALESGFYDQSHFTKCFKEYTGVTPMTYKSCL